MAMAIILKKKKAKPAAEPGRAERTPPAARRTTAAKRTGGRHPGGGSDASTVSVGIGLTIADELVVPVLLASVGVLAAAVENLLDAGAKPKPPISSEAIRVTLDAVRTISARIRGDRKCDVGRGFDFLLATTAAHVASSASRDATLEAVKPAVGKSVGKPAKGPVGKSVGKPAKR